MKNSVTELVNVEPETALKEKEKDIQELECFPIPSLIANTGHLLLTTSTAQKFAKSFQKIADECRNVEKLIVTELYELHHECSGSSPTKKQIKANKAKKHETIEQKISEKNLSRSTSKLNVENTEQVSSKESHMNQSHLSDKKNCSPINIPLPTIDNKILNEVYNKVKVKSILKKTLKNNNHSLEQSTAAKFNNMNNNQSTTITQRLENEINRPIKPINSIESSKIVPKMLNSSIESSNTRKSKQNLNAFLQERSIIAEIVLDEVEPLQQQKPNLNKPNESDIGVKYEFCEPIEIEYPQVLNPVEGSSNNAAKNQFQHSYSNLEGIGTKSTHTTIPKILDKNQSSYLSSYTTYLKKPNQKQTENTADLAGFALYCKYVKGDSSEMSHKWKLMDENEKRPFIFFAQQNSNNLNNKIQELQE